MLIGRRVRSGACGSCRMGRTTNEREVLEPASAIKVECERRAVHVD